MPDIRHEILIGAPAAVLYTALTSQQGLSAWWTPGTEATPVVNSIARFPFGSGYFKRMKIVSLQPDNFVQWECIEGAEEWIGTIISFKLQAGDKETLLKLHPELSDQISQLKNSNHGTVLVFHHDNWRKQTAMFAECNYTWGQFLRSLKDLCEKGTGRPWPGQHQ
jgi:uncharacterized protein YndB with AHSA1/START domain